MAITSGTQFNSYLIGNSIGVGGMGEVYRATDTKLKRDVAIKVLPADFAADADRLARFQREAELLASLNHSNIAQIFGLEKADGITALVMELIDGPTLAERIEQGPIPTDDALTIALQIADALEAAHERGIVHRDLKPANIKLKTDGRVKVLDFGIAKAMDNQAGHSGPQSPMLTTPAMTQNGMILGTAAYMSPEQARGKPVDRRTDIWAFGCVLYEMLTGQPAFFAEDVPLTLARVLSQATNLKALPATTPPALRQTIELCLEKDQKKRIADISDVRLALSGSIGKGSDAVAVGSGRLPLWRRWLPQAGALVLGSIVSALALQQPQQAAPLVNRFSYASPADVAFRYTGRNVLAVSPTGRHFVFNTADGLYLRDMGEVAARVIPGTQEDLSNPFFSPDGRAVAFYAFEGQQLKRIALDGGPPLVIATVEATNINGASWAANDAIFYGQDDGIYRVSANGGSPELVIASRPGERVGNPELLPDGSTLLFNATTSDWDAADIVAQSLTTGERTLLVQGGNDPHYLPTGHLVYALEADLFAVAFEPQTLSITGVRVPLVQGVGHAVLTASSNYGIATDGTLVYLSGTANLQQRTLQWVARNGVDTPIAMEPGAYEGFRLSPDGKRVVLREAPESTLWAWDFANETRTRLNLDGDVGGFPVWTPDSMGIAFLSRDTQAINVRAANNTGQIEVLIAKSRLTGLAGQNPEPYFFSTTGQELVFGSFEGSTRDDIHMIATTGDTEPASLLHGLASERNASLSPDGRWMAYQSDESGPGRYEVYVRPFPNVDDDLVQVSNGGGRQPVWSRDGSELFYLQSPNYSTTQANLVSVAVQVSAAGFAFGPRTLLLAGSNLDFDSGSYDMSADGQRFLTFRNTINTRESDAAAQSFIITQHWIEELKRLVPVE